VLLASGFFYCALLVSGNKLGYHEYKDMGIKLAGETKPVIATSSRVAGSYDSLIEYYGGTVELVELEKANLSPDGVLDLPYGRPVYLLAYAPSASLKLMPDSLRRQYENGSLSADRHGFALFGFAVYQNPENVHYFTPGPLTFYSYLQVSDFGFSRLFEMRGLYLVRLEGGQVIRRDGEGYAIA